MAFHTPPEVLLRQYIRMCSQLPRANLLSLSQAPCSAKTYKAAVCTNLGQPLEIQQMSYPTNLKETEILVATHACGINFADILTCKGAYQDKVQTPFIPGGELTGKVVEVGAAVTKVKKGDRVFALGMGKNGGFSEIYVANSEAVLPIPDNLSLVDAAATLVSYGTAMMALNRKAKLKKGERVLVTAAAGATGLAAVDIAKHIFDCEVIAVCGGQEKCKFLKERGADETIDYTQENVRERVKVITGGKGVDVAMDQVGGDILIECVKSLGFQGRALTIGYAAGKIPSVPANLLLLKSASLIGLFWGNHARAHPAAFMESITQVLQAIRECKINPYAGKTFPLEQINEAYQYIMDRKNIGKVVIQIREVTHPAHL